MADSKSREGAAREPGPRTARARPNPRPKQKSPAEKGLRAVKARSFATCGQRENSVRRRIMLRGSRKHYEEVIRAQLIEEFGYKNPFEVPDIEKIVLNMGVGEAVNDTKKVTLAAADLGADRGSKACHHPRAQRDRDIQGSPRTCPSAPRGDFARHSHV